MSEEQEQMEQMEQSASVEKNESEVQNAEDALMEVAAQGVKIAELEEMDSSKPKKSYADSKLEFLHDLELDVFIELGKAKMKIKDILELERGYVIELDKLASEPVDIYVNNKKIADGEVVVIDKHFGIRIMNLNDPAKRLGEMY